MPTDDCATDILSPDAQLEEPRIEASPRKSEGKSRRLRGLLFGFAASVTLGLALGSWYVGLRIVAASQAAPPTGLYLQLAGLGPGQNEGFVKGLQAQGWNARVQPQQVPGGAKQNARVVIGPFATQAEMEQARRTLQSAGVLTNQAAY